MGIGNCRIVGALILIPSCFCSGYEAATDTITSSQPIKDPETFSAGNIFEMGFFSPVNLTNRYVGIWDNNVSATSLFSNVWLQVSFATVAVFITIPKTKKSVGFRLLALTDHSY